MPAILAYFLIGFTTGLRSLTPLAVIGWGAHLGWIQFGQSKLDFIGKWPALAILTLLAAGELVVDKLPHTPARTEAIGLSARVIFGCLCAALISVACSGHAVPAGIAGVVGAITGTFAGYHTRHFVVLRAGVPDFVVALAEDAIAIAGSLWIVSHPS